MPEVSIFYHSKCMHVSNAEPMYPKIREKHSDNNNAWDCWFVHTKYFRSKLGTGISRTEFPTKRSFRFLKYCYSINTLWEFFIFGYQSLFCKICVNSVSLSEAFTSLNWRRTCCEVNQRCYRNIRWENCQNNHLTKVDTLTENAVGKNTFQAVTETCENFDRSNLHNLAVFLPSTTVLKPLTCATMKVQFNGL